MARVTGIGGVFFKARDPKRLSAWYRSRLGLELEANGSSTFCWREKDHPERKGYTVWGPFSEETSYFDPSPAPFMVNYRVDDLDGLLAELRRQGVEVEEKIEEYEYGRFAWVIDPEGNKIELWEPSGVEPE